jgi:hypothetical protein
VYCMALLALSHSSFVVPTVGTLPLPFASGDGKL